MGRGESEAICGPTTESPLAIRYLASRVGEHGCGVRSGTAQQLSSNCGWDVGIRRTTIPFPLIPGGGSRTKPMRLLLDCNPRDGILSLQPPT